MHLNVGSDKYPFNNESYLVISSSLGKPSVKRRR